MYRPIALSLLLGILSAGWLAANEDPPPPPAGENAEKPADSPDAEKPATPPADGEKPTGGESKPTEPLAPAAEYAQKLAEWRTLESKLKSVRSLFIEAPQTSRIQLLEDYRKLADDAYTLLPKLRFAAIAAYQEAPNKDEELTRMLIGIMADDNRGERHTEAIEIGKLLADNDCQEQALAGQLVVALFCSGKFDEAAVHLKAAEKVENTQTEQVKLCLAELNLRAAEQAADDLPRVKITTTKGDVVVELFENEAPGAVGNFVSLVEKNFYEGLTFHRVLDGFMAQGGCPKGDGTGGPGYKIYCECYKPEYRRHFRGSLAMAHSGRNTGGSQFYITFGRPSGLDGRHTVFGRVIEGMEVVDSINRIDPQNPPPASAPGPDKIIKAEVIRKRGHVYEPDKVEPAKSSDAPQP